MTYLCLHRDAAGLLHHGWHTADPNDPRLHDAMRRGGAFVLVCVGGRVVARVRRKTND